MAGYAPMVSSSKSSFRQLKRSQASQFSLFTISLYKFKLKTRQNTVRIPPQVTSLLLCSTNSNSFATFTGKKLWINIFLTSTKKLYPSEVWRTDRMYCKGSTFDSVRFLTTGVSFQMLTRFFGKESSGWAMSFTLSKCDALIGPETPTVWSPIG